MTRQGVRTGDRKNAAREKGLCLPVIWRMRNVKTKKKAKKGTKDGKHDA
jgi:hypothetical protein